MRISNSAIQNGVLRSGCFKIALPPLKKVSLIIVRQFCCFSGLPMYIHVPLQNTLQDSDSQENHHELYNYALVKFLVVNLVNVFAIYLLVIESEVFLHNLD